MRIQKEKVISYISDILSEKQAKIYDNQNVYEFDKIYIQFVEYCFKVITDINSEIKNIYSQIKDINELTDQQFQNLFSFFQNSDYKKIKTMFSELKMKAVADQNIISKIQKAESIINNIASIEKSIASDKVERGNHHDKKRLSTDKYSQLVFNVVYEEFKKARIDFSGEEPKKDEKQDLKDLDRTKLKYILELEKISYEYFSNIEILLKKFDSIRIDMGEYSKKWEAYNLLNAQTYSREILKKVNSMMAKIQKNKHDKFMSNNKFVDIYRDTLNKIKTDMKYHSDHVYTNTEKEPDYDFEKQEFLSILYNPKININKVKRYSMSYKKATSINSSMNLVRKYEQNIKGKLKVIHEKLWDKQNSIYYENDTLSKIFLKMLQVRKIHKISINKIVGYIEKANKIEDSFSQIGPEIDKVLKFIGFVKLDIRHLMLQLLINKNIPIDAEKMYNDYRSTVDAKMIKRLMYWNMFRKIGWTNEEPPDWMYGNTLSQVEDKYFDKKYVSTKNTQDDKLNPQEPIQSNTGSNPDQPKNTGTTQKYTPELEVGEDGRIRRVNKEGI